jgi:hypothetical protein
MHRTKRADGAADETGGENVVADETIESGEGVVGPVDVDGEQATSDLDGDATPVFADQEPIEERITLADLTLFSCRWPIGNPHDLTTFRYCGEAAPCGSSYCKQHARLAYLRRKT